MHEQWSLLLVDLIGVGAVVAALAYGMFFRGIFAKWSDLTISDPDSLSSFNRLCLFSNGPWWEASHSLGSRC